MPYLPMNWSIAEVWDWFINIPLLGFVLLAVLVLAFIGLIGALLLIGAIVQGPPYR